MAVLTLSANVLAFRPRRLEFNDDVLALTANEAHALNGCLWPISAVRVSIAGHRTEQSPIATTGGSRPRADLRADKRSILTLPFEAQLHHCCSHGIPS